MTNLIAEARELCEKATPGPWEVVGKDAWRIEGFPQVEMNTPDGKYSPVHNDTDAADRLESQEQTIAALTARAEQAEAREKAAIADMKLIADNVRETHCDETCCFACKFDCDTSINDSGVPNCECPGFERDDCFEWRGPQEARKGEAE